MVYISNYLLVILQRTVLVGGAAGVDILLLQLSSGSSKEKILKYKKKKLEET